MENQQKIEKIPEIQEETADSFKHEVEERFQKNVLLGKSPNSIIIDLSASKRA